MLRKRLSGTSTAITDMLGNAQSLMGHSDDNGNIKTETPNKQLKEAAKKMGASIPAYMKLSNLKKMAYGNV